MKYVIVGVICLIIGAFTGSILYAMVSIKRINDIKWDNEKHTQELIATFSKRIYALEDTLNAVRLAVKDGRIVGVPNHQLMVLNDVIRKAEAESERQDQ